MLVADENSTHLVIFAYGNPSRGDDALGPYLLDLIETHLAGNLSNISYITDFQLQIEHAVDLEHCQLALFIDADVSCPAPLSFSRIYPKKDISYSSHALHPTTVLYVYEEIYRQPAPPSFLLTVRGEFFELGFPLSDSAQQHAKVAFQLLKNLCEKLNLTAWENFAFNVTG